MKAALGASIAIVALAVNARPAEKLTLPMSLERAVNNNPKLLLAKKDTAISKTQLRQAKSLFYPKINLNLDYVRYRNETLGVTAPELGGIVLEAPVQASRADSRGNPLSRDLYLGRLGFLQTLYAGGRVNATYRLSQANVRRAENAYESLRQEVQMETAVRFYRLVALNQKEQLLISLLADLEKMGKPLSSVHSRLAVSMATDDVRRRLSELRSEKADVRFRYLEAMGLELFTDFEIDGDLTPAASIPDLQTVLVWAKQNRSELRETLLQEEVDQLSVELSRSERYPVFLLGGGMEVRDEQFPLEDQNWNAVVSMNIPVFDGFSGYARVKESRYRADQGRLKRVQLEDQVEAEVRSAHADWLHWNEEIKARQKQVDTLEAARKDVTGGDSSLAQRLDYWRWLSDARGALIDAQYEVCSAQARLGKVVGRDVVEK